MKVYAQFYHNSTGYVPNSIPPQFKAEYIKPIEILGSEGVYILDGRNNLDTMINDVENRAQKLLKKPIGYKIIRAERFTDKGKILYSSF